MAWPSYDEQREVLEFKRIPGSNGYMINCFGQVFHHKTKAYKELTGKKYGTQSYITLVIDGRPQDVMIADVLFKLFGVTHHKEDEKFDDLMLRLNRERKV
jgi:hypothetical protein